MFRVLFDLINMVIIISVFLYVLIRRWEDEYGSPILFQDLTLLDWITLVWIIIFTVGVGALSDYLFLLIWGSNG